jgi:flavin reductase (DIM6/NTAB) family NADH-FMN oxidoreductase RutF
VSVMALDALAPLAPDRYRSVFGAVCTPVAVVTTGRPGRPHGTTVSAFTSLSLDPPLVLVSLDRGSDLLRAIRRTRAFAINVLAAGQEELARRFASKGAGKFDGVAYEEEHGLPRLRACQGFIAGRVQRIVAAGDHALVIGLVLDAEVQDGRPLLYHERRFHALPAEPSPSEGRS